MRRTTMQLGLLVLASGLALLWHVASFPTMAGMQFGPAFFPRLIGIGFALCGAGLILGAMLEAPASRRQVEQGRQVEQLGLPSALRFAGILAAMAGFALLAPSAGFLIAAGVTTAAVALVFGARPVPVAAMVIVMPVALWLMFERLFRVTLPRGLLEAWLTGGA